MISTQNSFTDRIQEMVRELASIRVYQVDIANAAGVSNNAVSLWVKGKIKSLKLDYAIKIEKSFGYRAAWLVSGEGPKLVSEGASSPAIPSEPWPFSVPYSRYLAMSMRARRQLDEKVSNFIEGATVDISQEKEIKNTKTGTFNY